jgi:hypothetical protein
VSKCDGSAYQQWKAVEPKSAAASKGNDGTLTQLKHNATGKFLSVSNCAHAPLPHGIGPDVGLTAATDAKAPGMLNDEQARGCGGKNLLWGFHANKTITTAVDGQCLNIRGGTRASDHAVQTFACESQGLQANGQWTFDESSGTIISKEQGCLTAGRTGPTPSPPPTGTGSELWAKPMSDGNRIAVLMLNLQDTEPQDLIVNFADLLNKTNTRVGGNPVAKDKMPDTDYRWAVRDLWAQKDLGAFTESYTAKAVPAHGAVVLTVSTGTRLN